MFLSWKGIRIIITQKESNAAPAFDIFTILPFKPLTCGLAVSIIELIQLGAFACNLTVIVDRDAFPAFERSK